MSAEGTSVQAGSAEVLTREAQGVYATLFDKINLNPVTSLADIEHFQNADALSEVSADERVTAAVSVFLDLLKQSSQKIERLNKTLLDEHIAALDGQISRQLDAVMHHADFQRVEATWRGVKSLIDQTDFRRNPPEKACDGTRITASVFPAESQRAAGSPRRAHRRSQPVPLLPTARDGGPGQSAAG